MRAFFLLFLISFGCLAGNPGSPEYGAYHEARTGNESANASSAGFTETEPRPALAPENTTPAQENVSERADVISRNSDALSEKVIPSAGITLPARWNDIGPRIVEGGALNITRFEALLERNGRPLTMEQRAILENGSDDFIRIDRNNSYFVLNLFWALGLTNDNKILRNFSAGIGSTAVGNLASTGFWSLGERSGRELFASRKIIELTGSQQAIVEEVTAGTYRPCCDNPTAFPDCNHGMAALGLAEWMAYQNASGEEIYGALLAANSYWFPQAYVETAAYLEYQNVSWESLEARELLSANYSSYSGYQTTKRKLEDFPPVLLAGSGCGA